MSQFYCLGFAFNGHSCDEVALIRKQRPAWQKNQLNGVGGKVEKEEDPSQAMTREWREETGDVKDRNWELFLLISGTGPRPWEIHCYRNFQGDIAPLHDYIKNSEVVTICNARLLPASCLPNLRWIIPLASDTRVEPVTIVHYAR